MKRDVNLMLRCLMAAGALLVVGCGGEEAGTPAPTGIESQVNPLEASGKVEFFVKLVGTRTGAIKGEATTKGFEGTIPGIRYFSELDSPSPAGRVQCTAFRFTEAAGIASPLLAKLISSGEVLKSVHMDFVRPAATGAQFIWQKLDLTGMRVAKLEQAAAPPTDLAPSTILEEVTLVPTSTAPAHVTLTDISSPGAASIVSTFTCGNSGGAAP
jgi:type VI protein secretion system component Hcp